jgi:hypothetical protein
MLRQGSDLGRDGVKSSLKSVNRCYFDITSDDTYTSCVSVQFQVLFITYSSFDAITHIVLALKAGSLF